MKRIAALLGLWMVISGFCTLAAQDKKYAIKSGIVTFEQVQKVGDIESKEKFIVYFHDFGKKGMPGHLQWRDPDKLVFQRWKGMVYRGLRQENRHQNL